MSIHPLSLVSALVVAVSCFAQDRDPGGQPIVSDLPKSILARLNDLERRMIPPVGTVVAFAGALPPEGWMVCDGRAMLESDFAELFQAIGSAHGSPGEGRFNLPDYRGRFLRGVDSGYGRDPDSKDRTPMNSNGQKGDAVGSCQGFSTAVPKKPFRGQTAKDGDHQHEYLTAKSKGGHASQHQASTVWFLGDVKAFTPPTDREKHSHNLTVDKGGDAETRPANAYVNWIIRVR